MNPKGCSKLSIYKDGKDVLYEFLAGQHAHVMYRSGSPCNMYFFLPHVVLKESDHFTK